jgi:hypothetical protein
MTENDFFVAIQAVLEAAHEQGLSEDQAIVWAYDAIEEWREENFPDLEDSD